MGGSEKQEEEGEGLVAKSQLPISKPDASLSDPNIVPPTPKQQTKPVVNRDARPYLWNARGKRKVIPTDLTPPKKVVIDKVLIYIQTLTSEQAKNCNVRGWDGVLACIDGLRPEAAEHQIANFWLAGKCSIC